MECICEQCHGSGKISVEHTTYISRESEVMLIDCDGMGILDPEQMKSIKQFEMRWCRCKDRTIYHQTIYHDNNITPWDSCVLKHHYHCAKCLKLVQIG
jgi:hypothetical protein